MSKDSCVDCSNLAKEIEGLQNLVFRQSNLLTGVVNAVRGEPDPDSLHSHHDAADLVKHLINERDNLAAQVTELESIICPNEKSKYLGFTVSEMLYHLSKDCRNVRLNAISEGEWSLYIFSEQYGEFEIEGGLFRTLAFASKPFIEQWRLERKGDRDRFDSLMSSIQHYAKHGVNGPLLAGIGVEIPKATLHLNRLANTGIDINQSSFIKLEGFIGEDYAAVLYKAHELSCKLNIAVQVDLNNYVVTVKPDSDIEAMTDKLIKGQPCN